jgi:hypothetical protein
MKDVHRELIHTNLTMPRLLSGRDAAFKTAFLYEQMIDVSSSPTNLKLLADVLLVMIPFFFERIFSLDRL